MTNTGDMEEMEPLPTSITCEQVDREDLDTRYLRGDLDPSLAEAFEAHYFACGRCWNLVKHGNELRSVGSLPETGSRISPIWLLAAAAVLAAAVGTGLWRVSRPGPVVTDSLRSGNGILPVPMATADPNRLILAWQRVPGAVTYRARLFRSDGTLILEREVSDTTFSISRDSVGAGPGFVWQVHALDRLGNELVRFPLAPVSR